jgi:hypothetical protein
MQHQQGDIHPKAIISSVWTTLQEPRNLIWADTLQYYNKKCPNDRPIFLGIIYKEIVTIYKDMLAPN